VNIDYAAIIEKANARKDALLRLNDLLQELPQHLKALDDARCFSASLYAVLDRLDPEAQELVGGPGMRALYKFQSSVAGLYSNGLELLDYPGGLNHGNGKSTLQNLRALIGEQDV